MAWHGIPWRATGGGMRRTKAKDPSDPTALRTQTEPRGVKTNQGLQVHGYVQPKVASPNPATRGELPSPNQPFSQAHAVFFIQRFPSFFLSPGPGYPNGRAPHLTPGYTEAVRRIRGRPIGREGVQLRCHTNQGVKGGDRRIRQA